MTGVAVVVVVIVLLILMGINGAEIGDFVGDFLEGLRPDE